MANYEPIPKEAERWGKALLDAAFEVYTLLGLYSALLKPEFVGI